MKWLSQAKLYMSIIEDVVESMRELILDEGLEDRVLDDLKRMWEAKVMASKALEDIRHNNITSSKFVLQLPAHYNHSDEDRRPRVGIPTSQNAFHFPLKVSTETVATFSLPPGLSYPVQIPAGVTLQTASGQLYKVNVPVVVTQGPAGSNPFSQTTQKIISWRESSAPQPAGGTLSVRTVVPKVGPASTTTLVPPPPTFQPPAGSQPPPVFSSYPELLDIVQLDGPLDNSDIEAEDEVALEDNDFLGMINAEDPLNSGDDVQDQDIPDLFDTDNVIVCQYDKIHRSKNRWKFHLKDAVMCYGGRDYVFSKAIGEAEW
uniref:General transcription factor IIA, 1-like n=1 Tax=Gadus morhua TaxID=8049 RepID=A0A8C5CYR0_GADMO